MKKAKAHVRYKTSDGIPAVGVTTVLGKINKPFLIQWANRLGIEQGLEVNKYVDALANIGTLIHALIEADLKNTNMDLGDYSKNEIDTAQSAFKKWITWKVKNSFELLGSEIQAVSDTLRVGGTCDIYCKLNGVLTVLDLKTSKSVYSEHKTQCVAYAMLLRENGKQVDHCRILRIGRSENEGMDDVLVGGEKLHWDRFLAYLGTYRADKNLERSGA